MTEKPYTDQQVRAGADALVRLRTQAPSLSELDDEEQECWLADARAVLAAALAQPARHVIAFADDGTWSLEHPSECQINAGTLAEPDRTLWDCHLRRVAEKQITPDLAQLMAGGRYTCSVGDLGDLFQLGDRLHDDQCTTPICAACGCWCHAEEQTEG